MDPEGPPSHKHDQRAGAVLLWNQAERLGIIQTEEEKVPGMIYSSLPAPKGTVRKMEKDFIQGHVVTGYGIMALN